MRTISRSTSHGGSERFLRHLSTDSNFDYSLDWLSFILDQSILTARGCFHVCGEIPGDMTSELLSDDPSASAHSRNSVLCITTERRHIQVSAACDRFLGCKAGLPFRTRREAVALPRTWTAS